MVAIDRARVLKDADRYLTEAPVTVTASGSPRSAGGKHDFFSEGDYWWPDPNNPDGPYIQRDGMSNPANFVEHRRAMIRLSLIVPALAAAYKITRQRKYSDHAARHLRAWFIDDATRMNPNLQYAQAIQGRFTGRGTGIIDTLHLVEVARAARPIDLPGRRAGRREEVVRGVYRVDDHQQERHWRSATPRTTTAPAGSRRWRRLLKLTGNREQTAYCLNRFKTVLIPNQEAPTAAFRRSCGAPSPTATRCSIWMPWRFWRRR